MFWNCQNPTQTLIQDWSWSLDTKFTNVYRFLELFLPYSTFNSNFAETITSSFLTVEIDGSWHFWFSSSLSGILRPSLSLKLLLWSPLYLLFHSFLHPVRFLYNFKPARYFIFWYSSSLIKYVEFWLFWNQLFYVASN